jgi:polyisoprenoid-binding protein YceI
MVQYALDPSHTTISFSTKHLGVSTVRGHFARFEGRFEGPEDDLTQIRGEATIDVASITTNNDQRDGHLKSPDFFDVANHPTATLGVTGIEHIDGDQYRVRGDLTIKATTRPVILEATLEGRVADPFGGMERLGLTATGQINRMDFGLNWDGLAGAIPMAGHQVKLTVEAAIVVQAAEVAKSA